MPALVRLGRRDLALAEKLARAVRRWADVEWAPSDVARALADWEAR